MRSSFHVGNWCMCVAIQRIDHMTVVVRSLHVHKKISFMFLKIKCTTQNMATNASAITTSNRVVIRVRQIISIYTTLRICGEYVENAIYK